MDLGLPIAGGASLVLLGIVFAALFRVLAVLRRQGDITDYRLETVELERDWCRRNFGILANSVIRAGGIVDPALYDPPPMPRRRDPRLPKVKEDKDD